MVLILRALHTFQTSATSIWKTLLLKYLWLLYSDKADENLYNKIKKQLV